MAQSEEKSQMISIMAYDSNRMASQTRTTLVGFAKLAICLAPLLMAGCSSVPTELNPVHWFDWAMDDGADDEDSVADAVTTGGTNAPRPSNGLVGDGANAGYAAPIRRDVAETKPLVKRTNDATAQAIAAASVKSSPAAPVASGVPAQAPSMVPPAKPDVPAVVVSSGNASLEDHYRQRLQESAVSSVAATQSMTAAYAGGGSGLPPLHLNPPKSMAVTGGGASGSSFQVAALNFRQGSSELSPSDQESLREVVRLFKKNGGMVRILGLGIGDFGGVSYQPAIVISSQTTKSGPATSIGRAEAIARELTRQGVPGSKILVGAVAPGTPPSPDGAAARIYLDL